MEVPRESWQGVLIVVMQTVEPLAQAATLLVVMDGPSLELAKREIKGRIQTCLMESTGCQQQNGASN